jgi:hypothetical protein
MQCQTLLHLLRHSLYSTIGLLYSRTLLTVRATPQHSSIDSPSRSLASRNSSGSTITAHGRLQKLLVLAAKTADLIGLHSIPLTPPSPPHNNPHPPQHHHAVLRHLRCPSRRVHRARRSRRWPRRRLHDREAGDLLDPRRRRGAVPCALHQGLVLRRILYLQVSHPSSSVFFGGQR